MKNIISIETFMYFIFLVMLFFTTKEQQIILLIIVVNFWLSAISEHLRDIKNK